mmetsp:Transcript_29699/g.90893  ORF Transcript_29699/g.90893 Transcript_29699/m.90893 type:complete len:255 (-) Transcript_29699:453-1217(-)
MNKEDGVQSRRRRRRTTERRNQKEQNQEQLRGGTLSDAGAEGVEGVVGGTGCAAGVAGGDAVDDGLFVAGAFEHFELFVARGGARSSDRAAGGGGVAATGGAGEEGVFGVCAAVGGEGGGGGGGAEVAEAACVAVGRIQGRRTGAAALHGALALDGALAVVGPEAERVLPLDDVALLGGLAEVAGVGDAGAEGVGPAGDAVLPVLALLVAQRVEVVGARSHFPEETHYAHQDEGREEHARDHVLRRHCESDAAH